MHNLLSWIPAFTPSQTSDDGPFLRRLAFSCVQWGKRSLSLLIFPRIIVLIKHKEECEYSL